MCSSQSCSSDDLWKSVRDEPKETSTLFLIFYVDFFLDIIIRLFFFSAWWNKPTSSHLFFSRVALIPFCTKYHHLLHVCGFSSCVMMITCAACAVKIAQFERVSQVLVSYRDCSPADFFSHKPSLARRWRWPALGPPAPQTQAFRSTFRPIQMMLGEKNIKFLPVIGVRSVWWLHHKDHCLSEHNL